MSISMIGIDHSMAPVDIRAKYAFTRKNSGVAMAALRQRKGISGCIILSTCNRLEVWVSIKDGAELSLYDELCELKDIEERTDRSYFIERTGREAAEHLFYLTSGLKSQIFGEDQILAQVKDALGIARENFASDGVLEVLFRMAITVGKKIKTEIPVSHGNPSVIHRALEFLNEQKITVKDMTCMVIGNGEMGKVAAQTLMDAGADVTVTVRQYRSGVVNIPAGAKRMNYGDRMEYLPECDLVVSATASPNLTIRKELFENIVLSKPVILIDLAVPRDIEPAMAEMENVTLYDMDSFTTEVSEKQMENLKEAGAIVNAQLDEFFEWYDGRDMIPRIQKIKEAAVHDLDLRIAKAFKNSSMDETETGRLEDTVNTAASKVVNKLIFGLRDEVSPEVFLKCIMALEKLYEE